MRMLTIRRPGLLLLVGISTVAIALCGCPAKESGKPQASKESPSSTKPTSEPAAKEGPTAPPETKTPGKPESTAQKISDAIEEAATKPRDLGPPLVDNESDLKRLHPEQPVWIDAKRKQVVIQGEVCAADYPLEFFATYPNRSYEAVLSVNVRPSLVHTGLLAVGAKPGHPVSFHPKFSPPTGTEIAIELRWKNAGGKIQSTRAQDWVRNIRTKKALDTNWIFAGSVMGTDSDGKPVYLGDSGELICLLNLPGAMLDLPIRSEKSMDSRIFEAFTEHLPPQGTPTTIIFKPILKTIPATPPPQRLPAAKESPISKATREEAEKKAIAAADAWLALIDRNEYSQGWETASASLKKIARKDFVRSVSDARKPLGKLKVRQLQSKEYTTSLPGAPKGQYVVLQYKTTFANRKTPVVETVTPMLDKDKVWRVSGYYVK